MVNITVSFAPAILQDIVRYQLLELSAAAISEGASLRNRFGHDCTSCFFSNSSLIKKAGTSGHYLHTCAAIILHFINYDNKYLSPFPE